MGQNVVLQVGAQIGVIILLVLGVIIMWNRRLQIEIKHREQLEKIIFHDSEGNLILDDSFFRVGKAYEEMIISETGELILGNLYTEKLL